MKSIHSIRLAAGALVALLGAVPVLAQNPSQASTNLSRDLSLVTGSVVVGSLSALVAGSTATIQAVERVGDSVVVVLKGASEATTVSVRLAASALGGASLAIGGAVRVVGEASGYVLYAAGKVIAFIPNEIGRTLIHHSRIGGSEAAK